MTSFGETTPLLCQTSVDRLNSRRRFYQIALKESFCFEPQLVLSRTYFDGFYILFGNWLIKRQNYIGTQ